ncbi:alpha/beta hydrolase [Catellatospora sichuanensis]|uniref:alpha/beta hydrolase n=1 Tax=Catellatospora sichuanensis TaxID=1969805 RepID=UPI0016430494|nr:alpha/beta hydrolase [Catellatospora sichuanensis]
MDRILADQTKAAGSTVDQRDQDGSASPPVRRWIAERERWAAAIAERGVDWDHPRTVHWNAACGTEAAADFAAIRRQARTYAAIAPAFAAAARHREDRARTAEAMGDPVTARENYFMAAVHWSAAQWPGHADDAADRGHHERKRACYSRYAELADHHVEAVSIPFPGTHRGSLPAWLHLPPGYTGGRTPVAVVVPDLDSCKEATVALHGDRFLSRGFAVLAMEGPGQYECALLGTHFSVPAWAQVGTACLDWLAGRAEVDPEQVVLTGSGFGSFAATIAAAHEPRIRACAVMEVCHEPGWTTVFEQASPTHKMRFMYMTGHTDEAEFDRFSRTITWQGHAERLRMPYLAVAGEDDELSPLEWTRSLLDAVQGPRQLVVYQDSPHHIGGVPSARLGPFASSLVADWLAARVRGDAFPSEQWIIDVDGRINRGPLPAPGAVEPPERSRPTAQPVLTTTAAGPLPEPPPPPVEPGPTAPSSGTPSASSNGSRPVPTAPSSGTPSASSNGSRPVPTPPPNGPRPVPTPPPNGPRPVPTPPPNGSRPVSSASSNGSGPAPTASSHQPEPVPAAPVEGPGATPSEPVPSVDKAAQPADRARGSRKKGGPAPTGGEHPQPAIRHEPAAPKASRRRSKVPRGSSS